MGAFIKGKNPLFIYRGEVDPVRKSNGVDKIDKLPLAMIRFNLPTNKRGGT